MSTIPLPEPAMVLLVGTSGSGKSTFAARHFREDEVLSSDEFRALVGEDESDQSVTAEAFEALHVAVAARLDLGHTAVIDATNLWRRHRGPLVRLARDRGVLPVAIVLDVPERVCLERNRARGGRYVSSLVVRRQQAALRRSLDGLEHEGFDRVVFLHGVDEIDAVEVVREPRGGDVMKIGWGVMSTAKIGVEDVIPGMRKAERCNLVAIASRDPETAKGGAERLAIPRAHGSYGALLDDPEVEAVYIPLPNHLHAEWTLRAAEAGKHVLCEKPLAMTSTQAEEMVEGCRKAGVLLMEAFMYRLHPQWVRVRELVAAGRLGELLAIQSFFSYRNVDPENIRNISEFGGGALMDIGCYPINLSRMLFGEEPSRVRAAIRRDPAFGTDVVTSAVLEFGDRHSTFTCSTQIEPDQRVHLVGTQGRLVVEIPFNAPTDRPTRLLLAAGGDPPVAPDVEVIEIPTADQYAMQVDAFSAAVAGETAVPTPPEDAIANMRVIEMVVAAAERDG